MGEAWGDTLEVGGRADIIGKVLPRGSPGGTLVLSGGIVAHRDNE